MKNLFNHFLFSWVYYWHTEWNPIERLNSACAIFSEELQPIFIWSYWGPSVSSVFLLQPDGSFPLGFTFFILYCHSLYSYDHELVFGVSLKNMNKAERLTFGESLMTHAMTFTAVSEKVWPSACLLQCVHRWTSILLQTICPAELHS